MIDQHIPLEQRLFNNSDPLLLQSLSHLVSDYGEQLGDEEVQSLRKCIVLIAAVREALANRAGKRTRSLQLTSKGRVDFEANKAGGTINLLGSFPKEGSSTSTFEAQEVIIRRKDQSCEVLIVDPTPLG